MSAPPPLAIPDAIQQLRTEILAADWQLSPERSSRLKAAFAALRIFFADRPHALALLRMAISTLNQLDHQHSQGSALDFLKESMAHLVTCYEEDEPSVPQEKEMVSRAYRRFKRLNIPLVSIQTTQEAPASQLLHKLAEIARQTENLPGLLQQTAHLSPEQQSEVRARLGSISATLNTLWASLPAPDHGE